MTDRAIQNSEENGPAIPALSRQRLGDQVAEVLRHQIILGDMEPGRAIHERETADALGVSRTPLREALFILEAEGLVIMAPARTPIVANPSLDDLTQLLLVQSALEALAGEGACDVMTAAQYSHIERLHDNLLATFDSGDPLEVFKIDMAFHEAIVAATGNQPLIKLHKQYNARLWRARYMSSSKRINRTKTLSDHTNIVDALRVRDGERASNHLKLHLRNAIKNITIIFNQNSDEQ
ncbi:MAG: GntR family transcriptional regulator [Rhizobiales bacterium]|nr:GntR family transcriptional regulator [Hyphomicrobiales bacterium]